MAGDVAASLPLAGMVDLDAERERLQRELDAAQAEKGRAEAQLSNEQFVARAPAQVVEAQRRRLGIAQEQIDIGR